MWELDHREGWVPKNWHFWIVPEKTLGSLLDCKEIKPVNPKGNQPWGFIEGLMLKMKLQFFGHLMWRADSLKKTLMLGKTEGRRRRWQRMKCLESITDSNHLSKPWKIVEDRGAWHTAVHGASKSQTQLRDWTTTTSFYLTCSSSWPTPTACI